MVSRGLFVQTERAWHQQWRSGTCDGQRTLRRLATVGLALGLTHIPYQGILSAAAQTKAQIMAHTVRDKRKLLLRVRRIRGQIDALAKLLEVDADCSKTLHLTVACRGAINSLMAEILEGHIRFHVVNPDDKPTSGQVEAAQEVIEVVRSYLK